MRLAGTTVLLTAGAERCEPLALGLSREGARLLLHGGEDVARVVRAQGSACEVVVGGVATVEEVERLVEDVWSRFAPIRGVVLSPTGGAAPRSSFLDDGIGVWHDSLERGLELPFFLIRTLASRMGEEGGGAIVIIVPRPSSRLDAVSRVVRAGLVTMTRGLAKVLPDGVRIGALSGGSDESRTASAAFLLAEPSLRNGTIVELES
jgi:NAD(P)-dependent dehydrogenase (short-subunit alcohol dehydrogenase family)